jgi:Na+-translocating ferredoxin:NAD+ oxidoreductase subunit B
VDPKQVTDQYSELAAKFGFPESKVLPQIIKKLASPEEASIMLQCTATSEQIAEKLSMDKQKVDDLIQVMYEKGLVFPTRKGWRIGRMIDSLHDMTLTNLKFWDSYGGKEYGDLWRKFEREEWFPSFASHVSDRTTAVMRIIPDRSVIADTPGLIPEEDMRAVLEKASPLIVVPCPCRRENYGRTCGSPDELCFSLGRSAEYNIKRGVGRKVTVDEALEIIKTAHKHNAVTSVPNCKITNQIICNCHSCCCVGFRSANQLGVQPNTFGASRYAATVTDTEKCSACQKCIETCQFDAVGMKKYPDIVKWKSYIDPVKCRGCGNCVIKCNKKAITMELVRPADYIPDEITDMYTYDLPQKKD